MGINYVLPLGSIVYLKEGTAKMMIVNRRIFVGEQDKKEMFVSEWCRFQMKKGLIREKINF